MKKSYQGALKFALLWLFCAIGGTFMYPQSVSATYSGASASDLNFSNFADTLNGQIAVGYDLFRSFYPSANFTLSTLQIKATDLLVGSSIKLSIVENNATPTYWYATASSSGSGVEDFEFENLSYTLTSGNYYNFYISALANGGGGDLFYLMGDDCAGNYTEYNSGKCAYRIFTDTSPSISITLPQNGTSLGYFSNWEYTTTNIQNATDTSDFYVVIRRATSTTSTQFIDDSVHFPLLSSSGGIPRSGILTNGTYYAQAYVLSGGNDPAIDTVIASSEVISWTSDGDLAGYYPEITATTSISSSTIECSSGGLVENAFCSVLKFLFVPSENSISAWTTLWDDVKEKPPMGYLVLFTNELSEIENTSTSTEAYELPDLSSINFFHDLKVGVGGLLSLLTLVWAINRFRHIRI
jgi:hypothetical protein